MTDMTDITDEQRAAWDALYPTQRILLAPLLPSELTGRELPTESGHYASSHDKYVWTLDDGLWTYCGTRYSTNDALGSAPFTRLVPERPQITREQIVAVFDTYGDDYDLETISDLVDLANGTDRD